MATGISLQLYKKFYDQQSVGAESVKASAHWKNFSQSFQVEHSPDGSIRKIKGYGFGGSDDKRLSARIMSSVENGLLQAWLSYPGLATEKREAKKTVAAMGLSFSRDAFRQVCTRYFLKREIAKTKISVKNILIIGDGHGILAALIGKQYPEARIFLIDLGATLFFQAYYLENTFTDSSHVLLKKNNPPIPEKGFFYCPAENLEDFPLIEIDLAINIASMQEMDIAVVNDYFSFLRKRKTKLFYCCNRLEKTLPDEQVTRFEDYQWLKEDLHLKDEKCPWHQFFFARSTAPNLKLFHILPIPMLHHYDGVHWHRLTKLSH